MQLVWQNALFRSSGFKLGKVTESKAQYETIIEDSKKLYCIDCKNLITDLDAAISIDGSHTHTFTNPAGYTYTIGCFQSAIGCLHIGEPTEEYTWFNGYAWQIAVCESCKEQLGWFYSYGSQFYGLISERLTHVP